MNNLQLTNYDGKFYADSREVAEKIADELGVKLVYCDKKYIPFFKD